MKFQNLIIALSCAFLLLGCGDDENVKQQPQSIQPANPSDQIATDTKTDEQKDKLPTTAQAPEQPATKSTDEFELSFLNGDKFPLKKDGERFEMTSKDKATLFVFFATWCPPCRAEIPHLNNLNDKFKKELNIVAVLLEDIPTSEIEKFAQRYKIKYNVAIGENNFLLEKAMGGIVGLPSSALFKPNGEFFSGYTGMVPEEMMERDILKAIEQ